mmetsp:Transcript_36774/g.50223  ORF Transcript_36774/g.50223 Transcript_36774/m.50223 type:complete len:212 (-) Transcript_36774:153-788(-)
MQLVSSGSEEDWACCARSSKGRPLSNSIMQFCIAAPDPQEHQQLEASSIRFLRRSMASCAAPSSRKAPKGLTPPVSSIRPTPQERAHLRVCTKARVCSGLSSSCRSALKKCSARLVLNSRITLSGMCRPSSFSRNFTASRMPSTSRHSTRHTATVYFFATSAACWKTSDSPLPSACRLPSFVHSTYTSKPFSRTANATCFCIFFASLRYFM